MKDKDIHGQDILFEMAQEMDVQIDSFPVVSDSDSLNDELKQKEWKVILSTISSVNGSRKDAADKLGISQRTLRYKLAKMREAGIDIPGRSAELL
jgi:two-component system response regulator FlrC